MAFCSRALLVSPASIGYWCAKDWIGQWSVLEVWYQKKFVGLGRRCDKNLNAKTYGSADYER